MTATPAIPLIDLRRCTGCGLCAALCPTKAMELREGRAAIVRPEACSFCSVCETFCPTNAIGRPFVVVLAPQAVGDVDKAQNQS